MRQHHVMHNLSSVPQPQPVLPTYKWMQVKRNVPKPTGESHKNFRKTLQLLLSDFFIATIVTD
jgi:hypothetical protein